MSSYLVHALSDWCQFYTETTQNNDDKKKAGFSADNTETEPEEQQKIQRTEPGEIKHNWNKPGNVTVPMPTTKRGGARQVLIPAEVLTWRLWWRSCSCHKAQILTRPLRNRSLPTVVRVFFLASASSWTPPARLCRHFSLFYSETSFTLQGLQTMENLIYRTLVQICGCSSEKRGRGHGFHTP